MGNKTNVAVGDKFGNRTIIEFVESNNKHRKVKVRCDCGKEETIQLSPLILGHANMCKSCARKYDQRYKNNITRNSWYAIFLGMKRRCYNLTDKKYKDYGGRGISICEEWLSDPWTFGKWAESNGYKKGLQIDRIDNDGNYEPSNCRWVTNSVNVNNRRNTIFVTILGETLPLEVMCRKLGINCHTVRWWKSAHSSSFEEAIFHYLEKIT